MWVHFCLATLQPLLGCLCIKIMMMKNKFKLAILIALNSTITIYCYISVLNKISTLSLMTLKNHIGGLVGSSLVALLCLGSVLMHWYKPIRTLGWVQGYYLLRMIVILIAVYLLYDNTYLTMVEIIIGYFLLLLNSFLGIKNERNFRSLKS